MSELEQDLERFRGEFARIQDEVHKVLVGQDEVVRNVLIAIFAGGHCLLEGVPGLGKTLLVKTLAAVLDLEYSRIQFTPDLMPADILGTRIVMETPEGGRRFEFQRGPIFGQIILADEVNRATPKTQSALLEAMQEHTVTVGRERFELKLPFFVLATQNPLEMDGTYPLPEAQLDRFLFKVLVEFPSREELGDVLGRTTDIYSAVPLRVVDGAAIRRNQELVRNIAVAPHVRDYAIRLVLATHPEDDASTVESVRRFVRRADLRAHAARRRSSSARRSARRSIAAITWRSRTSATPCSRGSAIGSFSTSRGRRRGRAPTASSRRFWARCPKCSRGTRFHPDASRGSEPCPVRRSSMRSS